MTGDAPPRLDGPKAAGQEPLPWLVAALAFFSLGSSLCILSGYDLASQFNDDAFYYFQIARNVAHGHGITFDGIHATNGFHPLWLLLLVPFFGLLPGMDAPVRAAGILEAALVGTAAAVMYRGLAARTGRAQALLGALALFALPGLRGVVRTGLEGALALALLVLAWWHWLRCRQDRTLGWLKVGVCFALLALARVESIALLGALAFVERRSLAARPRAAGALLLPAVITLAVYMAWSTSRFGVALPVSGLVKHVWATRQHAFDVLGIALPRSAPAGLSVLAAITGGAFGVGVLCASAGQLARVGADWLLLGASGMFAIDLLSIGHVPLWYRGALLPGLAATLAVALGRWRGITKLAVAAAMAGSIARPAVALWVTHIHRLQAHIRGEAADALRAMTTADARIGAWNGGMLGYYSGRHVVMLDGLANDVSFYRRVIVGSDLAGYLQDEGITHLALTGCKLPLLSGPRGPSSGAAAPIEARVLSRHVLARDPHTDPCEAFTLWLLRAHVGGGV